MYHKWRSYDIWFLRYRARRTDFFVILEHFFPFTLLTTLKIKIFKNGVRRTEFFVILDPFSAFCQPNNRESQNFEKKKEKNTWRYYPFIHMYHKWKSCYVWFLRYGARRTDFFVILNHFLPFYSPNNPKNQNFEKMKKLPGDIIILHKSTKIVIICYTDPEIRCVTDVILFFISGHVLSFYPPDNSKNQNLKKMKNNSGR